MVRIIILFFLLCNSVYAGPPLMLNIMGMQPQSSGNSYKFFWDCETTTANLDSGNDTEVGTLSGGASLSTDYAQGGSYSVKIPTSPTYSYYYFTDSSIFDPTDYNKITIYFYDDYKGAVDFFMVYGNNNNQLYIYPLSTNAVRVVAYSNGGSVMFQSSAVSGALNANEWNKIVITFDARSGTDIDYTLKVNNSDEVSGYSSSVWSVGFAELRIGCPRSYGPSSPLYLDTITIE